jgi:hypothetical protein
VDLPSNCGRVISQKSSHYFAFAPERCGFHPILWFGCKITTYNGSSHLSYTFIRSIARFHADWNLIKGISLLYCNFVLFLINSYKLLGYFVCCCCCPRSLSIVFTEPVWNLKLNSVIGGWENLRVILVGTVGAGCLWWELPKWSPPMHPPAATVQAVADDQTDALLKAASSLHPRPIQMPFQPVLRVQNPLKCGPTPVFECRIASDPPSLSRICSGSCWPCKQQNPSR